jgi:acyl-homoserine-lactone acylase
MQMKPILVAVVIAAVLLCSGRARAGQGTLYRDEFGIPHIYAEDLESAAFTVGYAQAEDRLEELLKNYRRATGRMAEVFGPGHIENDLIQRAFRHEEISRERYSQLSSRMRRVIEAYQEGIRQYMREHPQEVPAWAQEIHPWDVVALGRYIVWGWPLGEAAGDLMRSGIEMEDTIYRGSNEALIAPARTAMKAPIAIIDPHLSWYGEFRFYQVRIYAGDFNVSGVSILGTPLPSLGHSRYCSIAMTTGGPDTSDVFAEELNPDNPKQYRYDGKWRDLEVRKVKVGVKRDAGMQYAERKIEYSHHGPIVAHKKGKAYAMAIPYMEEVGLIDQIYETMTARNLDEMKRALGQLQLMGQNVMVATVQGQIYYVRNGRVPIRAPGTDPSRAIDGSRSTNEWRGIHPFSDLVQIENPEQGYMHNCNVTPFAMMKNSPLIPEKFAKTPYLYNATRNSPRHQRAEMMTDLLDAAQNVTVEDAIALAFNPQVYHAERWQERLKEAWGHATDQERKSVAAEVYDLVQQWNRRSEAASGGALAYYAFKKALEGGAARAVEPPVEISDGEILAALQKGGEWLKENFGSVQVEYGKYFRVGRQGGKRTYPVGGGSVADAGMATVRAIGFRKADKEMVGHSGQTSTQIVIMTDPPESYTVVPLGVSDHPESGHWDDQAERLFSQSKATPTFFMNRTELLKHVTSTRVLAFKPPLPATR